MAAPPDESTDRALDDRVDSARRVTREMVDPAPPSLDAARSRRERRTRRCTALGAAATVMVLVAVAAISLAWIRGTDEDTVVADSGPETTTTVPEPLAITPDTPWFGAKLLDQRATGTEGRAVSATFRGPEEGAGYALTQGIAPDDMRAEGLTGGAGTLIRDLPDGLTGIAQTGPMYTTVALLRSGDPKTYVEIRVTVATGISLEALIADAIEIGETGPLTPR